jgi:hypothetical protein
MFSYRVLLVCSESGIVRILRDSDNEKVEYIKRTLGTRLSIFLKNSHSKFDPLKRKTLPLTVNII